MEPINLFDFEALAEAKMEKVGWDYIAGAATDEITLRRTRSAYDHIALRPRVLTGTAGVDLATTVLGHTLSVPFMTSPAGGHTRAHPDGELATARAAAKFGTAMSMSANGGYTIEEGAETIDGPRWYQCYFYRNRETMVSTVKRAERVRARALDLSGKVIRIKAEGLLAQALEHETDHLNGYLYIDRLVSRDTLWKVTYNPEGEPEYHRVNSAEAPEEPDQPDGSTADPGEPPDQA